MSSASNEALKLWAEWFEKSENHPFESGVMSWSRCFFCDAEEDGPDTKHEPDCIYIRALELQQPPPSPYSDEGVSAIIFGLRRSMGNYAWLDALDKEQIQSILDEVVRPFNEWYELTGQHRLNGRTKR